MLALPLLKNIGINSDDASFAFMGSSLALILWFIDLDISFQQIINEKSFVLEYTMAILTTLAALLVLPLTCVTTAYLFTKRKNISRWSKSYNLSPMTFY